MLLRTQTGLTTATKEADQSIHEVSLYPNPVTENVVLKYSLEKPENLHITLCDPMGKTLDQLLQKVERSAGNHEEHLNLNSSLVPGCYYVKIETAAGVKAIPIVKK
jgi:hypothetical protein